MRKIFEKFGALLLMTALVAAPAWAQSAPDAFCQALLRALENPAYEPARRHLAAGGALKSGTSGEAATALQQMLCDLGAQIAVDGLVGEKTVGALNEILSPLTDAGDERPSVESAQMGDLNNLLLALLIQKDPAAARALLMDMEMDAAAVIQFHEAAAQLRAGNRYSARLLYEAMEGDQGSAERALACPIEWPKDGQLYRNDQHSAKDCVLTIQTTRDESIATYVKIYADEGELVAALFLGGSTRASVSLPAGTYFVNAGIGTEWYGPNEAFGDGEDASYRRLTFLGGGDHIALESRYQYTLTLQMEDDAEGNVGAYAQPWEGF